MITKIKFNSQICTTREQSERLIALGLKKETADMRWANCMGNSSGTTYYLEVGTPYYDCDIPAWSLHRLIDIYNYNQNNNGKYIFDSTYLEHCYNQIIHDISIKIQKGELEDLVQ